MLNSDYNILKDWMFGKLTSLLENTEPNPKYPIIKMSLGEPTMGLPDFTKKILDTNYKDWAKYPPSEAIPSFGNSILNYIKRRYPGTDKLIKLNKNIVSSPAINPALIPQVLFLFDRELKIIKFSKLLPKLEAASNPPGGFDLFIL